jgi:hypothetical protein
VIFSSQSFLADDSAVPLTAEWTNEFLTTLTNLPSVIATADKLGYNRKNPFSGAEFMKWTRCKRLARLWKCNNDILIVIS